MGRVSRTGTRDEVSRGDRSAPPGCWRGTAPCAPLGSRSASANPPCERAGPGQRTHLRSPRARGSEDVIPLGSSTPPPPCTPPPPPLCPPSSLFRDDRRCPSGALCSRPRPRAVPGPVASGGLGGEERARAPSTVLAYQCPFPLRAARKWSPGEREAGMRPCRLWPPTQRPPGKARAAAFFCALQSVPESGLWL